VERSVLIADGNTGRGQRLLEACTIAGFPSSLAGQGAQALEMALSEPPAVLVARVDLPLLEATRLAEILRANPRTGDLRLVFLGDEPSDATVGDVWLPETTSPDRVVERIADLLATQARMDDLDAATRSGGEARGRLSQMPLVDLLQLFLRSRRSGRLVLQRQGDDWSGAEVEDGCITLRDGDVIQASCGAVESEKALFRLLAWAEAEFVFSPADIQEPPTILTPTRALLQEGLRQRSEWDRLATKLPPLSAEVRLCVKSSELPNIVHPLTQEVLLLLELYARVRDVVDQCSFPDYQVLRTLHTLAERQIVSVGRSGPASTPGLARDEAAGLFDAAQARRLREWMSGQSGGDTPRRDAKLLVTSADPGSLPDLLHLMAQVPGVQMSREVERGEFTSDDLLPLARVQVDDEVGVELIHVPRDVDFAAFWPVAARGAVATLLLLAGSVGNAVRRLDPVNEALEEFPRSRTFHVVLLRKGERVSPDELRENLSLIDEASLFLLPLESRKDPRAVLRGLFSRVVP